MVRNIQKSKEIFSQFLVTPEDLWDQAQRILGPASRSLGPVPSSGARA